MADYLGVKREYLWQLAGLLEDMDYDSEPTCGDTHLRFHFAQADNLPRPARNLIISIIQAIKTYVDTGGQVIDQEGTFTISGNNKGLMCPFGQIVCQAGYCKKCETYLQLSRRDNLP